MLTSIFEKHKIYLKHTKPLLIVYAILSAKNEDFTMEWRFVT